MNVLELKGSIIERVAQLENESILASIDAYIKKFIESHGENWFKTGKYNLTPEQEAELLIADSECDDPANLVSHEDAVNEIESWLRR